MCEPSPISLQFPEVPGPQSLKIEGIVVGFLVFVPLGTALVGLRMGNISRYLPVYLLIFCTSSLLGRFILFLYYSCAAGVPWQATTFSEIDFPHALLGCRGSAVGDIGGTTLNAIHALQKGLNPYTIDVQGSIPTSLSGDTHIGP